LARGCSAASARSREATKEWADKIHVICRLPGQAAPIVIEISISEAKRQGQGNLCFDAGDVIGVEQTPMSVFMSTLQNFAHFSLGAPSLFLNDV